MSSQEKPTGPIDFAIVTALKVERDAVLAHLDDYDTINEPDDPYVYFLGTVSIPGSADPYRVVVVMLLDPGNIAAAAGTERLMSRWQPENVLMVGIAGGIARAGVATGDVVIARYVHYYEPGKRMPAGEQRRPEHYFTDLVLRGKARNYEETEWRGELNVAPPGSNTSFVPTAYFGPIASGEQVIADAAALAELLEESPKLLAVAMEGAGVSRAAASTRAPFLEIRGISDLADSAKNDDWHAYAADAAAAFTIGFLRSKPVTPRAERDKAVSGNAGAPPHRLTILRAQSLRQIEPTEVLSALPVDLQGRDHSTVPLDFTDLTNPERQIIDPHTAVERLTDPQGELLSAINSREPGEFIFHGLAAIPLAFLAGYLVSDRRPVRFFDYHPESRSWTWPESGSNFPDLKIHGRPRRHVPGAGDLVVRISVSYEVSPMTTAVVVPEPLRAVDLAVPIPERSVVRSEEQVLAYGRAFRHTLDQVARWVPGTERVHVFYAGPMSLAFHLGQQVSENIHPPICVWNFSRGYTWGVDLGAVARGESGIVITANGLSKN